MTTQPILESFRQLSSSEKIRLLHELWDEIAQEAVNIPLSESQRRLLDERLQQHDDNPSQVEAWEQVRRTVLSET